MDENDNSTLIELTADVVAAYVGNNPISASEVPDLIKTIFGALSGAGAPPPETPIAVKVPAVSIKKSITHEAIICLEDGRSFKSLKRHLWSSYGLTPAAYREKWGLPKDYPMAAPAYREIRSNLAKKNGLGQGGRAPTPAKKARKAKSS